MKVPFKRSRKTAILGAATQLVVDSNPTGSANLNKSRPARLKGGNNESFSDDNPWRRRKSNSLEPVCAARSVEEFSVISVRWTSASPAMFSLGLWRTFSAGCTCQ